MHASTAFLFCFYVPQGSKTPKFTRGFVLFLAYAMCKVGVEGVSSSMDAVQPKILLMILQQVRWALALMQGRAVRRGNVGAALGSGRFLHLCGALPIHENCMCPGRPNAQYLHRCCQVFATLHCHGSHASHARLALLLTGVCRPALLRLVCAGVGSQPVAGRP